MVVGQPSVSIKNLLTFRESVKVVVGARADQESAMTVPKSNNQRSIIGLIRKGKI